MDDLNKNPVYIVGAAETGLGEVWDQTENSMVANIVDGEAGIGDRVKLMWRNREDAPPLPVWTPA